MQQTVASGIIVVLAGHVSRTCVRNGVISTFLRKLQAVCPNRAKLRRIIGRNFKFKLHPLHIRPIGLRDQRSRQNKFSCMQEIEASATFHSIVRKFFAFCDQCILINIERISQLFPPPLVLACRNAQSRLDQRVLLLLVVVLVASRRRCRCGTSGVPAFSIETFIQMIKPLTDEGALPPWYALLLSAVAMRGLA